MGNEEIFGKCDYDEGFGVIRLDLRGLGSFLRIENVMGMGVYRDLHRDFW